MFPITIGEQNSNYNLFIFYFKICLFTSKSSHENESHSYPCVTPQLPKGHSL